MNQVKFVEIRQPLKKSAEADHIPSDFFKGCLPQILLGPFFEYFVPYDLSQPMKIKLTNRDPCVLIYLSSKQEQEKQHSGKRSPTLNFLCNYFIPSSPNKLTKKHLRTSGIFYQNQTSTKKGIPFLSSVTFYTPSKHEKMLLGGIECDSGKKWVKLDYPSI